ncbi:hypothetical protein [Luteolibacter soli]|uniref:Uncharacterized protein n=1 Tax=Luteolibacter soli TaxID=3135280 RepID=A0ABU9AY52_9BACT
MKQVPIFAAILITISSLLGGLKAAVPVDSELREVQQLESLPPQDAVALFKKYANAGELGDLAKANFAQNTQLVVWVKEYFKETPVLFENYAERRSIITAIRELRAEWAVRFLLELSRDDRPMKSGQFDYDDPEFQKRMKEEQAEIGDWDDTGDLIFRRYGYGPPGGTNGILASDALRAISSVARLAQERRGLKDTSVTGTAGLSPDSPRIAEMVKEIWGEKAILNEELGLGVDNLPVSAGSVAGKVRRQGLPVPDVGAVEENASPRAVVNKGPKYALILSCGLLAAALAAVGWRWLKAD